MHFYILGGERRVNFKVFPYTFLQKAGIEAELTGCS